MAHHVNIWHVLVLAAIAYVLFMARRWWPWNGASGGGPGGPSPA